MSIGRDDRFLTDALGRDLAGAQVFYLSQPASVPVDPPPSPLLPIWADIGGTIPIVQPLLTDGFGHTIAYLTEGVLFTIAMYHPLFGVNPVILRDQKLGGGGGGGSTVTPFEGIPTGAIDGSNTIFTVVNGAVPLTSFPSQIEVWLNFPLVKGLGFSLSIVGGQLKITYANPPQPGSSTVAADAIWAQGFTVT